MVEETYGIKTNPDPPGNLQANTIIYRINQVLVNLVHTYNLQEAYVDDADQWMGILFASYFEVRFMHNCIKGEITGHLVLGKYIIL